MADARDEPAPPAVASGATPDARQPQPPAIDIEQLAERVQRLLLADLRLGIARGERPPTRTGG